MRGGREGVRGAGVFLVRPHSEAFAAFRGIGGVQPPMNLFGLAAFLRKWGFSVRVLDFEMDGFSEEAFRALLGKEKPILVGVSLSSLNLVETKRICMVAKAAGILAVVGGPHPTAYPRDCLKFTGAWAAVVGEGEETFLELAKLARRGGKGWGKVGGIYYPQARGKGVRFTGTRPPIEDLDSLPFPDRGAEEFRKYSGSLPPGITKRTAYMMASRGCPYSCSFCQSPSLLGRRWRARSVGSFLSEMEEVASLGYGHALIDDDIFGLDPKWLSAFCRGMKEAGLARKMTWTANSRVDLVDEKILRTMKDAGCEKICLGVESGSQRILDGIGKCVKVCQIEQAFRAARRAGIATQAYAIVGHIGETAGDIRKTEELLTRIGPDFIHLSVFAPLPGTRAYDEAVSLGLYEPADNFASHGYFLREAPCGNGVFSAEELVKIRDSIQRRFYLRPAYVLRRLASIRSVQDALYDLKGLAALLFPARGPGGRGRRVDGGKPAEEVLPPVRARPPGHRGIPRHAEDRAPPHPHRPVALPLRALREDPIESRRFHILDIAVLPRARGGAMEALHIFSAFLIVAYLIYVLTGEPGASFLGSVFVFTLGGVNSSGKERRSAGDYVVPALVLFGTFYALLRGI